MESRSTGPSVSVSFSQHDAFAIDPRCCACQQSVLWNGLSAYVLRIPLPAPWGVDQGEGGWEAGEPCTSPDKQWQQWPVPVFLSSSVRIEMLCGWCYCQPSFTDEVKWLPWVTQLASGRVRFKPNTSLLCPQEWDGLCRASWGALCTFADILTHCGRAKGHHLQVGSRAWPQILKANLNCHHHQGTPPCAGSSWIWHPLTLPPIVGEGNWSSMRRTLSGGLCDRFRIWTSLSPEPRS